MKYSEFLKTDKWRKTSSRIKERDMYTCVRCGKVFGEGDIGLDVHHLVYSEKDGGEVEDVTDDHLITLCHRCHYIVHKKLREREKKEGLTLTDRLYVCLRSTNYEGICMDCGGWGFDEKTQEPCGTCRGERYVPASVSAGYETMDAFRERYGEEE